MDDRKTDLIKHRLARAREAHEEAILMQQQGHWNACVNRLYYSCFYAVTALLAKEGFSSSKHSGVRSLFNQHFVKSGMVDRKQGSLFNQLFEERQEGDYIDYVSFDKDTVELWIPAVKEFITVLSALALNATE